MDLIDRIPESNLLIRESVCGRTLSESGAELRRLGWKVVGAVRVSRSLLIITARTLNQHALLYARHGRICSVNFGRPGMFHFN